MSANRLKNLNSTVCATCLSSHRSLFPVKDVKKYLLMFCQEILLAEHDQICWECKAMVHKLKYFRRRILEAQSILAKYNNKMITNSIETLSKLTVNQLPLTSIEDLDPKLMAENVDSKDNMYLRPDSAKTQETFTQERLEHEEQTTEQKRICYQLQLLPAVDRQQEYLTQADPGSKIKVEKEEDDVTSMGVVFEEDAMAGDSEDQMESRETIENIVEINSGTKSVNMYRIKDLTQEQMMQLREENKNKRRFRNSRYKCEKCIRIYANPKILQDHLQKHEVNTGVSCSVCELRFQCKDDLATHTQSHYRSYECSSCAFSSGDLKLMVEHHKRQHEVGPRRCAHCDMEFHTAAAYRNHRLAAHRTRHVCRECGQQCSTRHTLRIHVMQHTGGVPLLECEICHKKYRGEWGLRTHMHTHKDKVDEAAYCPECGIQFKTVYVYRVHLKTSLKHNSAQDLKHKCPHCDKRFSMRVNLRSHIDSIHSEGLNYICHVCSQAFKTTARLRVHVREKHEGKSKPKNKICDICAKAFNSKATLQQHINSHTGARPYACGVCGATFSYSGALYTHNKLKHKRRDPPE